MENTNKTILAVTAAICLICAISSAGVTYNFNCITNNSSIGTNIANQFSVIVEQGGTIDGTSYDVSFTFRNSGLIASTITEIYFDDLEEGSEILSPPPVIGDYSAGVSFIPYGTLITQGNKTKPSIVSPGNLPGGNELSPPFEAVPTLSSEAGGNNSTGIDINEHLELLFNFRNGKTFDDAITALNESTLRIGLHVRSIEGAGSNDSDSYVTTIVPAPGAFLLGGIGIACVGWIKRRKSF